MSIVRVERRRDGVAIVRFDTPGSPVNVLSRELMAEVGPALDAALSDSAIVACVVASAKPGTFVAGADLKQLLAIEGAAEGTAFSRGGQAILDRMAASPKPFVAAIDGPALGGGLEVALACRYRIASDEPRTQLALPEVQLGLLPGGGGTQRLPRLVGLPEALPLLLTGKRLRARRAQRMGLVDALTSPGGIEETAARAALMLAEGKLRRREPRRSRLNRLLESALLRGLVFARARREAARKTRGNYPAPGFILECVEVGWRRGVSAGLEREARRFGELVSGDVAKSLVRLFESMTALKKRPDGMPEPEAVERLAVLGGGFMGSGIAAVSVPETPVVVKDVKEEVLAGCLRHVAGGLERRVRSAAIRAFDRDRFLARLHTSTDPRDIRHADLVIEAVFEDLELKRRVLAETEAVISPDAVFASNTSALAISRIAEGAKHPERVLGMHYFSPVEKMPLLELIATDRTSEQALATAWRYGVRQGKTVVIVKDGPGFYTTRILAPFLNEAMLLVAEGAGIEDVDRAVMDFGYPVGPLRLLDEVGIDVAAHVVRDVGDVFEDRGLGASDALPKMYDAGYRGRKNRKGFYRYEGAGQGRRKGPSEEAYRFFGARSGPGPDARSIAHRAAFLMANEAVWCLQDGVLRSARDGDVAAILGLGFPPFTGGPFRWLDAMGPSEAVASLERLRDAHGARFEPAPMLRDLARNARRFHP